MTTQKTMTLTLPSDREILMTRTFDAPRDLVWKVITDPALIPQWWGPRRYSTIVDTMEFRPGGKWRFRNRDADGNEFAFYGVYREITPTSRIVQTFEFEQFPGHVSVETMTLEERQGKTTIKAHAHFDSKEDRDGMIQGGMEEGAAESYDRLAEVLHQRLQGSPLMIERVFDAPRELVFKAWTDPQLMMRWWGPKGFTAPACKIDLRVGGKYLNCMRAPDGKDYWSTGTYREIVAPDRLVMTDSFADEKGNVVPASHYGMPDMPLEFYVTVIFESLPGNKTKMILTHAGMPAGEMSEQASGGWNESFDKLAEAIKA